MAGELTILDADALMGKPLFVVEGLIPQGVSILCGAGKIGKSWLMLWLGLQVVQGKPVWGLPTRKCGVFYLCLEEIPPFLFRVVDFMDDRPRWMGTATELLTAMGEADTAPNTVTRHLARFADEVLASRYIPISPSQPSRLSSETPRHYAATPSVTSFQFSIMSPP